MGKSRLCGALVDLADSSGWITLRSGARDEGGRQPYVLLFDALDDLDAPFLVRRRTETPSSRR